MPMQYIKDDSGQTTAVIIPIAEWKDITNKHQDLKEMEKVFKVFEFITRERIDIANEIQISWI